MSDAGKAATRMFAMADRIGRDLERRIDDIEARMSERRFGSALLGIGIALSVIAGGLGAFGAIFLVLVKLFA